MSGIKHFTQETIDFILAGRTSVSAIYGVNMGIDMTSACGKAGLSWAVSDDKEGISSIDMRDKGLKLMDGYKKVSCPKCIDILKKHGL